jgi:hypothetical protein
MQLQGVQNIQNAVTAAKNWQTTFKAEHKGAYPMDGRQREFCDVNGIPYDINRTTRPAAFELIDQFCPNGVKVSMATTACMPKKQDGSHLLAFSRSTPAMQLYLHFTQHTAIPLQSCYHMQRYLLLPQASIY